MAREQNFCYNCGKEFKCLPKHWSMSESCNHPNFSDNQIEILTGILMGDACVDKHSSKNWSIVCNNTQKEYLDYLSNELKQFSRGVRLGKTAQESYESSGFSSATNPVNYNNIYRWSSISHPEINDRFDWSERGNKVFPNSISLTPTVLKHWYVCDGHYESEANRIRISMSNEAGNKSKISSYFRRSNIPEPSGYNESERTDGSYRCGVYWTKKDSAKLLDYMGGPLPGFTYKWPKDLSSSSI